MDKAIIVGVFQFLGFRLCLSFLEQGVEVTGINRGLDEEDIFSEEKRLLIGRNSNFAEKALTELSLGDCSEQTYVFIDNYSGYMKENEMIEIVREALARTELAACVILVPLQQYGERMEELITLLPAHDRERIASIIYLPIVYGPWQPLEYSLPQSLYEPDKPIVVNEKEQTESAVYIDDAIDVICHCVKTAKHSTPDAETDTFIIQAGESGGWFRCFPKKSH